MQISYAPGDIFGSEKERFGLVLSNQKALLISGGGRTGYTIAVEPIPSETTPLTDDKLPAEMSVAFRAVQAVLKAT